MTASAASLLVLGAAARGTLLLAPALAYAGFARRATASARHFACFAALVAILLLPALERVVPAIRLGILPPDVLSAKAGRVAGSAGSPPAGEEDHRTRVPALPVAFLLGWGAVAAVLLLRQFAGLRTVHAFARHSLPLREPGLLALAERTRREVGASRRVRYAVHSALATPLTSGLLAPVVLLPATMMLWSRSRARAALLHELSHVARHDCLTQLVAGLACAAYWFNPLVWLACRTMKEEREAACDDRVLASGARPWKYAAFLLRIVRTMRDGPAAPGPALALGGRPRLDRRFRALLGGRRRGPIAWRAASLFAAGALTVGAFVAALRPESAPIPSRRESPALAAAAPTGALVRDPPEDAPALAAGSATALPAEGLRDEETLRRLLGDAAAAFEARAGELLGGDRPRDVVDLLRLLSGGEWRTDGRTALARLAAAHTAVPTGGFRQLGFYVRIGRPEDRAGRLDRHRRIVLSDTLTFTVGKKD